MWQLQGDQFIQYLKNNVTFERDLTVGSATEMDTRKLFLDAMDEVRMDVTATGTHVNDTASVCLESGGPYMPIAGLLGGASAHMTMTLSRQNDTAGATDHANWAFRNNGLDGSLTINETVSGMPVFRAHRAHLNGTVFYGGLTVGANASGATAFTIAGNTGESFFTVAGGGDSNFQMTSGSGPATITASVSANSNTNLIFSESDGHSFSMVHDGTYGTLTLTQGIYVCTRVSGTNMGYACDANWNGFFNETCVKGAKCDPLGANNGGCGSSGWCRPNELFSIASRTGNTIIGGNIELTAANDTNSSTFTTRLFRGDTGIDMRSTNDKFVMTGGGTGAGSNGIVIHGSLNSDMLIETPTTGKVVWGNANNDLKILRSISPAGAAHAMTFRGQDAKSGVGGQIEFLGGIGVGANNNGGDIYLDAGGCTNNSNACGGVIIGGISTDTVDFNSANGGDIVFIPAAGGNFNILGTGKFVLGSNAFVVDPSDNRVGLGTSSPTVPLDVSGSVKASQHLLIGATTGARAMTLKSTGSNVDVKIESSSGAASFSIATPASRQPQVNLYSGSNRVAIQNQGAKVAITDGSTELFSLQHDTGAGLMKGDLSIGSNGVSNASGAVGAKVHAINGTSALAVIANAGAASVAVKSFNGSANFAVSSPFNQSAILELKQGSNAISLTIPTSGSANGTLAFTSAAAGEILSLSSSGAVFKGDLTVGNSAGPKALSVKSSTQNATLDLISGGAGTSLLTVQAPQGQNASMLLRVGTDRTTTLKADASGFSMSQTSEGIERELFRSSGTDLKLVENLTISEAGLSKIDVSSSDNDARVVIEGVTEGIVVLNAPTNMNAEINLLEGSVDTLTIRHDATSGAIVVGNLSAKFVSIARSTGHTTSAGSISVNGPGAKTATISSTNNAASFKVISGGASSAQARIDASHGQTASFNLKERSSSVIGTSGSEYSFIHDGSSDTLKLAYRDTYGSNSSHTVMAFVSGTSGKQATNIFSNITLGGNSVGSSASVQCVFGYGCPRTFGTYSANDTVQLTVSTAHGAAYRVMRSGGAYGASETVSAAAGQHAKLVLSEDASSFTLSKQYGRFAVNHTSGGQLFQVYQGSSAVAVTGDLTVTSTGLVGSADAASTLDIVSGGAGTSILAAAAPSGQTSGISLTSGAASMSLNHNGVSGKLEILNGSSTALFTLSHADGSLRSSGDLAVGGANQGPRSMTVRSTSADANFAVASSSLSASIVATSPPSVKARLLLTEGSNEFAIQTSGSSSPNLVVNDGSTDLLVLQPTAGTLASKGDMSLSGPGQKTLSIPSDYFSLLSVAAAGSSDATMNVTAGSGKMAAFSLSESGGMSYTLGYVPGVGSNGGLVLQEATKNLLTLTVEEGTETLGNLKVNGNMSVGTSTGTSSLAVRASDGEASLNVRSNSSLGSTLRILGGTAGEPALYLQSSGYFKLYQASDKKFHIKSGSGIQLSLSSSGLEIPGPVLLGNASSSIVLGVNSTGSYSNLTVEGGGTGQGSLQVSAQAGHNALIQLSGNANGAFTLLANGSLNKLLLRDTAADLLSFSTESAGASAVYINGDLTGPGVFNVNSTASTANFTLEGLTASNFTVKAPPSVDAGVRFVDGTTAFDLRNDASEGKLLLHDGTDELFSVNPLTGNVRVKGALIMGDVFEAAKDGTVKQDLDGHTMVNTINAADMDGTRTTSKFSFYTYSDGSEVTGAKITAGAETDFTSTASTHNMYLDFDTALNGSTQNSMRITSAGRLGLGVTSPGATLDVNGTGSVSGDFTVGCFGSTCAGARAMAIKSQAAAALSIGGHTASTLKVDSAGTGAAKMTVKAAAGQIAVVTLTQGGSTGYAISNDNTIGGFAIASNNSTTVMSIQASSSAASFLGNMTVGSQSGANAFLNISATSAAADVEVESDASHVTISMTSVSSPTLQLAEVGGNTVHLTHNSGSQQLRLSTDTKLYASLSASNGGLELQNLDGGLSFDGGTMRVESTGAAADMSVVSTASEGLLQLTSRDNSNADFQLGVGNASFKISNEAPSDAFVISSDSVASAFTLQNSSGSSTMASSLAVSGLKSSGSAGLSVVSSDSTASFSVTSGTSSAATVTLSSPTGQKPMIRLAESGSHSWDIFNDPADDSLNVGATNSSGHTDKWLSIGSTGTATVDPGLAMEGSLLTVGGSETIGAISSYVKSSNDAATVSVVTGSHALATVTSTNAASNATATVSVASGRDAYVSMVEDGGNAIKMSLKGVSNAFTVGNSTAAPWLTLSGTTGDMSLPGGLNVNTNKLNVLGSTGYVGIGKDVPDTPLHIYGASGLKVDDYTNSTVNTFQILSASSGILGGVMLNVDSNTSRVGVGTSTADESMHIYGGSVKVESKSGQELGDLNVPNGAIHMNYLAHDGANRIGGSKYFCMKIGSGVTNKAVGSSCGAACGGKSPESACDTGSTSCGTGGWCSNKGLHNHYFVVSTEDVYFPYVQEGDGIDGSDGRMYIILFKKNATETSRFIVGPGDGATSDYYNPASAGVGYVTLDANNAPGAKVEVVFGSKTYKFVTCTFKGAMWRCYSWSGV